MTTPALQDLREQVLGSRDSTTAPVTSSSTLDSLRRSILIGQADSAITLRQPERVAQLMQDNTFPTPFESDIVQGIENENLLDPLLNTARDFGDTMMDNGSLLGQMIRNPIDSSIALFGGLKDMIWEPAKAVVGLEDPVDFEQAKTLWKLMGTAGGGSILGAGVGYVFGGPLGAAALGALGGLAGDVAGEIMFMDRTAGEATADAVFWSALTLGVGSVGKAAVSGTIRAANKRVARLLQEDLARAGDFESVAKISQAIDDNLKGMGGVDNVNVKGYHTSRLDDGTWQVFDPVENKVVRRGIQTKEQMISNLDQLPDRSRTNLNSVEAGPNVPGQTTARPGYFTDLVEGAGDFLSSSARWISNITARSEGAERALGDLLGREVFLNQKIFRPLVRMSTALTVARRNAFANLSPITNLENIIFRTASRSTRANRRKEYGQYINSRTIDDIERFGAEGVTTKAGETRPMTSREIKASTDLQVRMQSSGASWNQLDSYSNQVRNRIRIHKGKNDGNITPETIAQIHADVGKTHKLTDAQKSTAQFYDGLLDGSINGEDILNIVERTKAAQRGNISRAGMVGTLKLTQQELRLIAMIEAEAAKHPLNWGNLDNPTRSAMHHAGFKTTTPELIENMLQSDSSIWSHMYNNNLAGFAFRDKLDPMQSLHKRIGDALWGEHVGTAWESGRKEVSNLLREAEQIAKGDAGRVGSQTRTPMAQGLLSFFEDMRSLQSFDSVGLEKNLDRILGKLGFEAGSAVTLVNAMTLLHGTGLLGFRPKLAMRDMFDAWGFYGAFTSFKEANGAMINEARHMADIGMDAWRKEVDALEKQGRISRYSFQSQLREINRSVSARDRVPGRIYTNIEKFSQLGESVSIQHKAYTFNQKAIYSQEVRRIGKIIDEVDFAKAQKDQVLRDAILDRAKIRGSDATLKHFNDLLIRNNSPKQFIEEAAEGMVTDVLGRFGHGFGPAGHGMFSRIFLTFRTFPSVRINAMQKLLTKGTAASKRAGLARLMAANGALKFVVAPGLGLRPSYLSLLGGTLYTGGPMLDVVHDLGEAASFGQEGAVADVLVRAGKQFVPFYAFKDVGWARDVGTNFADYAVEGWDMLRP